MEVHICCLMHYGIHIGYRKEKEKNMKARITKPQGMYYGEVLGCLFGLSGTQWHRVTPPRFTEWGARRELEKWKKEHTEVVAEFEI